MQESCINLCQPDGGKSWGACCGIYNYVDSIFLSLSSQFRNSRDLRLAEGTIRKYVEAAAAACARTDFR